MDSRSHLEFGHFDNVVSPLGVADHHGWRLISKQGSRLSIAGGDDRKSNENIREAEVTLC